MRGTSSAELKFNLLLREGGNHHGWRVEVVGFYIGFKGHF